LVRVFLKDLVALHSHTLLEAAVFRSDVRLLSIPGSRLAKPELQQKTQLSAQGCLRSGNWRRGEQHCGVPAFWAGLLGRSSTRLQNEIHQRPRLRQMGLCGVRSGVSFRAPVD